MAQRIADIVEQFAIDGDYVGGDVLGSGHIHETFLIVCRQPGEHRRYVLQRINSTVFPEPVALMRNVDVVLEHMKRRTENDGPGDGLRCLSLTRTKDAQLAFRDDDGEFWRMLDYIDNTKSVDCVGSNDQAFQAAAAFGHFQHLMDDLRPEALQEIIPDFHDTAARYRQFEDALARDGHNRAASCRTEIEAAQKYREIANELLRLSDSGEVPKRVVHNDTKISNVLFDRHSGKAVSVIDLDTVMPGLSLYDFGDLVRTAAVTVAEDDGASSRVDIQIDRFEALVRGYLSTAGGLLNRAEIDNLAVCGRTITVETALRFLTDYLEGDRYFRISRPYQNLDRCRNQLALAASIREQLDELRSIVEREADRAGQPV